MSMAPPTTEENDNLSLKAQVDEMADQIKAAEEKVEEMEEKADSAKRAALISLFKGLDKAGRAAVRASIYASDDDEKKEILESIEDEDDDYEGSDDNEDDKGKEGKKGRKGKKASDDDDDDDDDGAAEGRGHKGSDDEDDEEKERLEARSNQLAARLAKFEKTHGKQMIDDLVALRASLVATFDEDGYRRRLKSKSFRQLEATWKDRKDEFEALKAAKKDPAKHFGFLARSEHRGAGPQLTKMSAIINDGGIF